MLARVFEVHVKPGVDPYAEGPANQEIEKNEANYTNHPGFVKLFEMFDRASGRLLQISLWENEGAVETYLAKEETRQFHSTMHELTHDFSIAEPEINHYQVTKVVSSNSPALTQV